MTKGPFQRTSDCFVGKQIAIYIYFLPKKKSNFMEWNWNLYLATVPDCKEKQTVKLAVRLSPLILGYSRQVRVYTRWFNHLLR